MSTPRAAPRVVAAIAGCAVGLVLLGCGIVQVSHNTRYFATERDAGKTIQLHKGDEVTLNLVIANGQDWAGFSSDVHRRRHDLLRVHPRGADVRRGRRVNRPHSIVLPRLPGAV